MKICIFFDGHNFYRSLQRYDDTLRVDYDRLATWITQAVAGRPPMFARRLLLRRRLTRRPPGRGGLSQGARAAARVLREARPARAAHRALSVVRHRVRVHDREACGHASGGRPHPLRGQRCLRSAAVVVSGDDDFVPAVEAVNALGKQVWVATWSAEELSTDLRVRCFGHIHLSEGIGAFRVDRLPRDRERPAVPIRAHGRGPRLAERIPAQAARLSPDTILERGLGELQRAEARLPHVSRGYFVMRWKREVPRHRRARTGARARGGDRTAGASAGPVVRPPRPDRALSRLITLGPRATGRRLVGPVQWVHVGDQVRRHRCSIEPDGRVERVRPGRDRGGQGDTNRPGAPDRDSAAPLRDHAAAGRGLLLPERHGRARSGVHRAILLHVPDAIRIRRMGLAGWTSPNLPLAGTLGAYSASCGVLGFGFSVTWDGPPAPRPHPR